MIDKTYEPPKAPPKLMECHMTNTVGTKSAFVQRGGTNDIYLFAPGAFYRKEDMRTFAHAILEILGEEVSA